MPRRVSHPLKVLSLQHGQEWLAVAYWELAWVELHMATLCSCAGGPMVGIWYYRSTSVAALLAIHAGVDVDTRQTEHMCLTTCWVVDGDDGVRKIGRTVTNARVAHWSLWLTGTMEGLEMVDKSTSQLVSQKESHLGSLAHWLTLTVPKSWSWACQLNGLSLRRVDRHRLVGTCCDAIETRCWDEKS